MIKHKVDSKKGDNGKVLILGGSKEYYGAPIFSALSALISGIDLVYLCIPEMNRDITAKYSPSFIIRTFKEDYFSSDSIKLVLELVEKVDVVLVGLGLSNNPKTQIALENLYKKIARPKVIDASGLFCYEKNFSFKGETIITPHLGEFKKIFGENESILENNLKILSKQINATILLKGKIDKIASFDKYYSSKTGNESLTKGGTGDILSGLVSGFLAQGLDSFEACKLAVEKVGRAGERLYKKFGYEFLTEEILEEIGKLDN